MFPHLFPGEKHLKSLQSYSPGIFKFYFIFFMSCFCAVCLCLLWLHYLWGIRGVLKKCLFSFHQALGHAAPAPHQQSACFSACLPRGSSLPSQKSSAFAGGAKMLIWQPHSSSQMLAALLGTLGLEVRRGILSLLQCAAGSLEFSFATSQHPSNELRSFLSCYHGLLLFHNLLILI